MLSWLRRFPHDAFHKKQQQQQQQQASNANRRSSSSTSWRNKSHSFTARIIRCASTVVEAPGRRPHDHDDEEEGEGDDDDNKQGNNGGGDRAKSSPPSPTSSRSGHPPAANVYRNNSCSSVQITARAFTFRELATAADNFRPDKLIGEGGFGRVYKGRLPVGGGNHHRDSKTATRTVEVAVKQLDRNGPQGNGEFVVEVLMLSQLAHPNLVSLVGYCAEGDQRLLVYPLMPLGSLEDHLLRGRPDLTPLLPWRTRMTIAHGAASGLEYLHATSIIYRDLKSSNILLDADYTPRLSDFGLARLIPFPSSSSSSSSSGSSSSRVMGTYGYCAPEYLRTGKLSAKSDVYSFGVLLLELITGRRAIDTSRPDGEQSLVAWAEPRFGDPRRFQEMVDPRLVMAMQGPPASELNQAVGVAAMCLQEYHPLRPDMTDVVIALSFLATTDSPSC